MLVVLGSYLYSPEADLFLPLHINAIKSAELFSFWGGFFYKGQITLHLTRDNFIILPKLYIFYKYLFKFLISFSVVTAADEHKDRINNPVLFKEEQKKKKKLNQT